MTDHKYTDDDVIKALECCMKTERAKDCELMKCPACYKDGCIYFDRADSYDEYSVYKELTKDALSLINRQKAEIEALKIANEKMYSANKEQEAEIERLNECIKTEDEVREIMKSQMLPMVREIAVAQIDRAKEIGRIEAIAEFAERLKLKSSSCVATNNGIVVAGSRTYTISEIKLDTLVKEMTEEAEL